MNTITQTQITAYERCKRLYYLQMVRKLVWPVEAGKRQNITQGEDYHLLLRQLVLGFPRESLIIPQNNETLQRWINTFLTEKPLGDYELIFAEKEVSACFSDVLWLGKFDALTINGDQITIFDWKTGASKPDSTHYRSTPQTRLYRFLARNSASRLLGAGMHSIPAENIEMVYWFPEHPQQTIRLPYSEEAWQQDLTWLRSRAAEMSSDNEADYPKTDKMRQCEFCTYRTYCNSNIPVAEEILENETDSEEIWQSDLFAFEPQTDSEQEETNF